MFEQERQKASFDRKKLTYIIHGGKDKTDRFIAKQKIIQNDPILRFDPATIQRSRNELMSIYARKLIRYTEIFPQMRQGQNDRSFYFTEQLPLSLHDSMFLITLRNLCDDEQIKTLLEPAERREIIGCYAQTELGHGSDVQRLMTTATYNQKNQTFIINTPDIKAAKWWIGDLGVFGNHACVFAQLIIKGKKYGIHAFLVPIRDKDHRLFPGVQAGDIGPKLGFNCKDNGYAIFSNYQIPRRNMLMKYQVVSKEGIYSKVGDDKITYVTMLKTRATIPKGVFQSLSKAAVILTRFSLARKQFKDNKGVEIPILNYQLQQEKVFPRISQAFANLFAYRRVIQLADIVYEEAKQQNKYDHLNEAHIISSGVKAILTRDGIRGMEILRRAAGGHGYISYSGIPGPLGESTPSATYQGENTVLFLQVARYLIKSLGNLQKGKSLGQSVQYLENLKTNNTFQLDVSQINQLNNPKVIINLFVQFSCQRIKKANERLSQGVAKGLDLVTATNQYAGLQLIQAATAHTYLWLISNFYAKIQLLANDQNVKKILIRLFLLYGVQKIAENQMSFYESGVITGSTLKTLRQLRQKILEEIRPDALTIAEAFEYSDHSLTSAIGTADGKVYQHLLDWAKNHNDINKQNIKADLRKDVVKFYQQMRVVMKDVAKL